MNETTPFQHIMDVIDTLIGPEGCPWDRKQTPESLCDYVIEEGFELVEAIRSGSDKEAMEETGDVLFLLLFIARLFEKRGAFSLNEAAKANAAKMIRRHPHVFEDLTLKNQQELLANWERIKRDEKDGLEERRVYAGLPKGLPPLLRAYRIHSKAARNGFTWASDEEAMDKYREEFREWEEACASGDKKEMELEFGDLLFTLVELGRRKGIKANQALDYANRTFLDRFHAMEDEVHARGKEIADLSLGELDSIWDEIKASKE